MHMFICALEILDIIIIIIIKLLEINTSNNMISSTIWTK